MESISRISGLLETGKIALVSSVITADIPQHATSPLKQPKMSGLADQLGLCRRSRLRSYWIAGTSEKFWMD